MHILKYLGALIPMVLKLASAIEVNMTDPGSIKAASKTLADDLLQHYKGNLPGQVPGNLPEPYYWWECGAMFGSLIDYWHYTGDSAFNPLVVAGMQHQVGPNQDFMPPNQTRTLGNDDQCFWALSAMSAAENRFPDPPKGKPGWLALAQAVFNTQAPRWEMRTCGGGLKWQIYSFNNGYYYKNTISNGCFFNLAARLGLYTGNQTYADWAEKSWNWMMATGLIGPEYVVYDGCDEKDDCQSLNGVQWSYNAGILLSGAAAMFNYTNGAEQWRTHTTGLLQSAKITFFPNNIMTETACEPDRICNIDQLSFKAYLSRWLAATAKLAPYTFSTIKPLLRSSAEAAAKQCNGGDTGRKCGHRWIDGKRYDGSEGVGQMMSALEVMQVNLILPDEVKQAPASQDKGGTSQGDVAAGTGGDNKQPESARKGPWENTGTTSDRVGAWVVTGVVCFMVLVMSVWVSWDDKVNLQ